MCNTFVFEIKKYIVGLKHQGTLVCVKEETKKNVVFYIYDAF